MALAYKSLGQSAPSAASLTNLYTVPALTQAVGSSIVICNRSVATSFRLAVSPAGAAIANQHYLFYDTPIDANATEIIALGMALAATDVVRCYATLATISFLLFGVEIS